MGTFGLRAPNTFRLLEGLLWEPGQGYFLRDRHLARLQRSAEHFGFVFDADDLDVRLQTFADVLAASRKVRVELSPDGSVFIEDVDVNRTEPVLVSLATAPIDSANELLRHKTSERSVYERAVAQSDAQDVILWNELGELTETCTGNLVLRLDGRLWTPPVTCGLLPGTFREYLVERGEIHETVLPCDKLGEATALYLVNSVRRWCELKLTVNEEGEPAND